jgi:hypothetical protein
MKKEVVIRFNLWAMMCLGASRPNRKKTMQLEDMDADSRGMG